MIGLDIDNLMSVAIMTTMVMMVMRMVMRLVVVMQALNQLFEKIMALDVDERHLLRMGHGEEELETEKDYSRFICDHYIVFYLIHSHTCHMSSDADFSRFLFYLVDKFHETSFMGCFGSVSWLTGKTSNL